MYTEEDVEEAGGVTLVVKERTVEDLICYLDEVKKELEEGYSSGYVGFPILWDLKLGVD